VELLQRRAAKLGLDAYGPPADPLTVTAGTAVRRGTIAVLERLKETAGNLTRVNVNGNVLFSS